MVWTLYGFYYLVGSGPLTPKHVSEIHVEREIRTRKRNTDSVEDQIKIIHAMWEAGIGPASEGLRAGEIEEELDLDLEYDVGTSLGHLEDIDLIDASFKSNNEWHPVAEWKGEGGEIVFGDDLDNAVREAIEALIDHMPDVPGPGDETAVADGGATTVRTVVADEFDYVPEKIDDYLRANNEDVDTLNKAVQAVKESESVSVRDDYGEIDFIPRAYYYRLSKRAVDLYEE